MNKQANMNISSVESLWMDSRDVHPQQSRVNIGLQSSLFVNRLGQPKCRYLNPLEITTFSDT